MHRALYRKWRPATFDQVVGQEHITEALRYEVENHRVSHAYLFCGSRGTGKTTCAKILAKAVNCLAPVKGNPCGVCEACLSVDSGTATDVMEMDAASNTGVDYIRDIRDEVMYAPSMLSSRVYIIDEVHMLSDSAFNALLKTLEEPPHGVVFILATTEMQKIPATILSRCQSFDFRRIPTETIAGRLRYIAEQEGIVIDEEAAFLIGRLSQGGMRDAISLMELCYADGQPITRSRVEAVSGSAGRLTVIATVRAVQEKNASALFDIIADLHHSAKDLSVFWQDLMAFYRDMMVVKTAVRMDVDKVRREILDVTESEMETLRQLATEMRYETMLYHLKLMDEAFVSGIGRGGGNKRLTAEMTLLRMTKEQMDSSPEALLHRIRRLEDALLRSSVAPIPQPSAETPIATASEEPQSPMPQTLPLPPKTPDDMPKTPAVSAVKEGENLSTTKAPAAVPLRELRNFAEILQDFERIDRTAAAFLGEGGGYIDAEQMVHLRLSSSFHQTMLEKKNVAQVLARLIAGIEQCPVRGVCFEVAAGMKTEKNTEQDLSAFDDGGF